MAKSSGLTIAAFKAQNRKPGNKCSFEVWLRTRSKEDQIAVFKAFDDPTVQVSAIHRVLQDQKDGFTGSRVVISRSRSGCKECDALRASLNGRK
jgi:hypothetical protein